MVDEDGSQMAQILSEPRLWLYEIDGVFSSGKARMNFVRTFKWPDLPPDFRVPREDGGVDTYVRVKAEDSFSSDGWRYVYCKTMTKEQRDALPVVPDWRY